MKSQSLNLKSLLRPRLCRQVGQKAGQVEEIPHGSIQILGAASLHAWIELRDLKSPGGVPIVQKGTHPKWINIRLHRHHCPGSMERLTKRQCRQRASRGVEQCSLCCDSNT